MSPAPDAVVTTFSHPEGSAAAATPAAEPPVATTAAAVPAAPIHYASCAEADAAGVKPLHRGDPGYSTSLDRDGDGTACE